MLNNMGKVHVTIYHYDYFICLVCVNINTSCIISYTNILCVNDHVISEVGWTDLLWTGIHALNVSGKSILGLLHIFSTKKS